MENKDSKNKVLNIIDSMRTPENEAFLARLRKKVEGKTNEEIERILEKTSAADIDIQNYIKQMIKRHQKQSLHEHSQENFIPINDYFSYHMNGSTIVLHMGHQLDSIPSRSISAKMDRLNLSLIDAVEKIRDNPKFDNITLTYMISPILLQRELTFLDSIEFDTQLYKKSDLQNDDFLANNPEAQLATSLFGNQTNVGRASISVEKTKSTDWKNHIEIVKKKLHDNLKPFSEYD